MKALVLLLSLLVCLPAKAQEEADNGFPWEENDHYWQELFDNPDYQQYYQGDSPEEMIRKAMEHAMQNGITPENMEDFMQQLSEDITDNLLDTFEEAVLEQLMEELGLARQLDRTYQQILKTALPKPGGIPVHDPGMQPAITKANTQHNLKAMLKLAVEKWLNQQWRQQVSGIYSLQREDLEYRKLAGLIAGLKMAALDYEHFLSLEISIPEQLLDYATQLQHIYQSAGASLAKGKDLYTSFNLTATGLEIPQQIEQLHRLEESSKRAKTTSWEMINQRRKTLTLAYLQMAERAQEKGQDLQEAIKAEGYLKMSDADRLKAQQLVNAYLADSFHYKEKADQLLKASLHNAGTELKDAHIARYQQELRLKNLAE